MEWSAEKGNRRSGKQVPVKMFASLAASCLHILAVHVFIDPPLELSPFRLSLHKLGVHAKEAGNSVWRGVVQGSNSETLTVTWRWGKRDLPSTSSSSTSSDSSESCSEAA